MAVDRNEADPTRTVGGAEAFRARGGTLYVVATPLGNLRDVTLRALDVLGSADVVAAEDTRTSGNLLRHYGIATRLLSLHAHNEAQRVASVVGHLRDGRSVALVTRRGDAGDQRSGRPAGAWRARGRLRGGAGAGSVRRGGGGVGRRTRSPMRSCSPASCRNRRRRRRELLRALAAAARGPRVLRGAAPGARDRRRPAASARRRAHADRRART